MRKLLAVMVLLLAGCRSGMAEEQQAIASRLSAEASATRAEADLERTRAEAETDKLAAEAAAYQRRVEAGTASEIARSSIRQTERDASHERTMESLPYFAMVIGGLIAVLLLVNKRDAPAVGTDPAVLMLLRQQQRQIEQMERATWHLVAREQRRLPGERVTIYQEEVDA